MTLRSRDEYCRKCHCSEKGTFSKGSSIFSLEMSSEQLALRMLCGRTGITMTKLHDGFIPKNASESLLGVAKELRAAPLWIDESTNLIILEMRAKARRIHSKEHIDLIVIDYLQLINGDNRVPRKQQISEISRGIKAMAPAQIIGPSRIWSDGTGCGCSIGCPTGH
jgi:replicative DNA helicase